jgi:hypothetical protein
VIVNDVMKSGLQDAQAMVNMALELKFKKGEDD